MKIMDIKDSRQLHGIGLGLWAVFKAEVFFKIVTLFLVSPLLTWVYNKGVLGDELVFNADMFWSVLSPLGIILFVVLFLASALWCCYEINTVLHIVFWCREGKCFRLIDALKGALSGMAGMKHLSLIPASLYYVLLLPLVHTGYINSLVPRIEIPNFILGEMQRTGIGRFGIAAMRLAYIGVFVLLLLVPVAMAVKRMGFTKAVRQNFCWYRMLSWKDRGKIWGTFLVWLVCDDQLVIHMGRKLMQNQDFNVAIVKYLVRSASFREGFTEWLFFNLLQCGGMVLIFWLVLGILEKYEKLPELSIDVVDTTPFKAAVREVSAKSSRLTVAGKKFWESRKHKKLWICAVGALVFVLLSEYFNSPPLVHRPWVIGHRGCVYEAENTVAAIEKAAEMRAEYAEIDVQLTKDGVPVVVHDDNLWRLAGKFVNVNELTWSELQDISIVSNGQEDKIPSLEEMLKAALETPNHIGLLIELKVTGDEGETLAKKIIDLVEEYDFGEKALFMSLDYNSVYKVQEAHPEWWVGYCIYGSAGEMNASVWDYDIDFLAIEENRVSNRFLDQARNQWLPVYIWTVDSQEDMWNYLQMGAVGIITDVPDEARAVVDDYMERSTEYYSHDGQGYPKDY